MFAWESLVVVIALCAVLSFLSYRFGLLTTSGAVAAFLVGLVIGGIGSIAWLLILIVFTVLGFMVTKFRFQVKVRQGLQEGKKGERTYRNVVANSLVPAMIALGTFGLGLQNSTIAAIAYLSAIGVAAADTTASELGVLSPKTYLITTFRRVPPGTDGGISLYGTMCCVAAAAFSSFIGWAIIFPSHPLDALIIIPTAMGVTGCMIDSLIGATLERRGLVGKLGNNILSMAAGTILGVGIFLTI